MASPTFWATQSAVTEPGGAASSAIDRLGADLASLRAASSQLVFHYRGGDFEREGVPRSRVSEIDLRYADAMLGVVLSRTGTVDDLDAATTASHFDDENKTMVNNNDNNYNNGYESPLARYPRPGAARVVGCCRDATVLFLSLARHKGIPCRARVGFGSYCVPGWWMDHVVAEVWDATSTPPRWRLIEPEMEPDYRPVVVAGGKAVDWLDVDGAAEFLTGPRAWALARAGKVDASRFVVAPGLREPGLRGWAYLAHNAAHDLAALAKTEMLLWDEWGAQRLWEGGDVGEQDRRLLDEICAFTVHADIEPAVVASLAARVQFRVPDIVVSADPMGGPPRQVDVRRTLGTV